VTESIAVSQLGQLLVERELLSSDDFDEVLAAASSSGGHPVRMLLEEGRVDPEVMLELVAERLGIGYFNPKEDPPPEPEAVGRLQHSAAMEYTAVPLRFDKPDRLYVAMADPLNEEKVSQIERISGCRVVPVLGDREALEETLRDVYAAATGDVAAGAGRASKRDEVGEGGYHINELLEILLDIGGSDLHLTAGSPPQVRLHGQLQVLEGYQRLSPEQIRNMVFSILTGRQREKFENNLELDCSHPVPGKGRFRVNVFLQRGSVGAVLRGIPEEIHTLEDLGIPPVVAEFSRSARGMVLVTGATGQGKSTTLASIVDLINRSRAVHIMTVEDPIEFMHRHKHSLINQREVGSDTPSFASALKHALRQDPDVILVGELRDLETIETALTAAETGHLVFATLHTQDAPGSVERIIDVFPPYQQQQVRVQLASSLQGVVSQLLLPRIDGGGRVAAVEVLVATPAVRNLIREGKVHQIRSSMQAGGQHGMQTMEQSLAHLVRAGRISIAVATEAAGNVDELMKLLGGPGT
jgi:twitching motility protein PilT